MRLNLAGLVITASLTSLGVTDASAQSFGPVLHVSDSFGWENQSGGWRVDQHPRLLGDINGDGLPDIVGFGSNGVTVAINLGGGAFADADRVLDRFGSDDDAGGWQVERHIRLLGDVNGDGSLDIVGFGESGVTVATATGDGTFNDPQRVLSRYGAGADAGGWEVIQHPRLLGDVNGDGRDDIVGFGTRGPIVALGQANGTFTEPRQVLDTFGSSDAGGGWDGLRHPRVLGDVNGDGRADIVGFAEGGTYVSLGHADGTFGPKDRVLVAFGAGSEAGGWGPILGVDGNVEAYPRLLGDVNGDGRADIVGFGESWTVVALGRADGTFGDRSLVLRGFSRNADAGSYRSDDARALGDINADGRDDLVGMGPRNTEIAVAVDAGFAPPVVAIDHFGRALGAEPIWGGDTPRLVVDVSGDGRSDLVGFGGDGVYVALAIRPVPDMASDAAADPDQEAVLGGDGATPRFTWRVPERYAASWAAWNPDSDTYDESYVHPDAWPITVDACSSSDGDTAILAYRFELVGMGQQIVSGAETDCVYAFRPTELGAYRISVSVQTSTGWTAPAFEDIVRQDFVVVSLGDSFASSEGNPDRAGLYVPSPSIYYDYVEQDWQYKILQTLAEVAWQDRQCHRSALSGHAMTASGLEDRDPHSSVTFLSFACSGAEASHLTDDPYSGIECASPPCRELDPQLQAVASQVRDRTVDLILMAVGLNDLQFSTIIIDCANPTNAIQFLHDEYGCVDKERLVTDLARLPAAFDRVDQLIEALPGNTEVYIADYPSDLFAGGGCGLLDVIWAGISEEDSIDIATVGREFAWFLGNNADRLGWNFVSGMTAAFDGHSYCDDDSFYRRLDTSVAIQGNHQGTAHPNFAGHSVYRDLLLRAVVLPPFSPYKRITLVVDEVRLESSAYPDPSVVIVVGTNQDPAETRSVEVPVGEWFAPPPGVGTFEFDVYLSPVPPRYPIEVAVQAGGSRGEGAILRTVFTRSDNYGLGMHEAGRDGFSIRYHIEMIDIAEPCPDMGMADVLRDFGPSAVAPVGCEFAPL